MKIVFLDRMTIGNDIDVEQYFSEYEFISYELTKKDEICEKIKNADVIITNKVVIGREEMKCAENLKLICLAATGYNNIDIAAAKEMGITVANVADYSTDAVAQTVWTYVLAFSMSLMKYDKSVKDGTWSKSPIFTMLDYPVYEIRGSKLGIIGYGKIGERVAEIGRAFGMQIMAAESLTGGKNDGRYRLNEIFSECDFITIHVPLNDKTRNLITKKELLMMKKNAVIINTARGGIINENDLYEALHNNVIRGAALDVMTTEPPSFDNKLLTLDNIIITPHIAWAAKESRARLMEGIVKNIKEFVNGNADKINLAK